MVSVALQRYKKPKAPTLNWNFKPLPSFTETDITKLYITFALNISVTKQALKAFSAFRRNFVRMQPMPGQGINTQLQIMEGEQLFQCNQRSSTVTLSAMCHAQ